MDILDISKLKKEANITLDAGELVTLCNVFYTMTENTDHKKNITSYGMYDKFTMLNDLVQYGHIDAFRIEKMWNAEKRFKNWLAR